MAAMSSKKAAKLLDAEIGRLYARRCSGIQIPLMMIPNVYAAAKAAHAKGEDMGDAIAAYVETIRTDRPGNGAPRARTLPRTAPYGIVPLGQITSTRGVADRVPAEEIAGCVARHAAGDWGDVDAEDKRANFEAIETGARLLSRFKTSAGDVYVITEADRSSTCVLFPEEY